MNVTLGGELRLTGLYGCLDETDCELLISFSLIELTPVRLPQGFEPRLQA